MQPRAKGLIFFGSHVPAWHGSWTEGSKTDVARLYDVNGLASILLVLAPAVRAKPRPPLILICLLFSPRAPALPACVLAWAALVTPCAIEAMR